MIRKFKVNKAVHGAKIGDVIELECSPRGVIKDKLWRWRAADAEYDNCITEIKKGAKK